MPYNQLCLYIIITLHNNLTEEKISKINKVRPATQIASNFLAYTFDLTLGVRDFSSALSGFGQSRQMKKSRVLFLLMLKVSGKKF